MLLEATLTAHSEKIETPLAVMVPTEDLTKAIRIVSQEV
jgi:hypothetical protein